MKVFISQLKTW